MQPAILYSSVINFYTIKKHLTLQPVYDAFKSKKKFIIDEQDSHRIKIFLHLLFCLVLCGAPATGATRYNPIWFPKENSILLIWFWVKWIASHTQSAIPVTFNAAGILLTLSFMEIAFCMKQVWMLKVYLHGVINIVFKKRLLEELLRVIVLATALGQYFPPWLLLHRIIQISSFINLWAEVNMCQDT